MKHRLVIAVTLLLLSTTYAFAASTQPQDSIIIECKALCSLGEKQLKSKQYPEALISARKVLEKLPKSPRAKAIFRKAADGLSIYDQDIKQISESISNILSIELALCESQQILSAEINSSKNKASSVLKRNAARFESISDQLEEAEETDTEIVQEEKNGNTTIRKTRKLKHQKQRNIATKQAELDSVADRTYQFISNNNREIGKLNIQYSENERALADAQKEMTYLCALATSKAIKRDGYKLALTFAKAGATVNSTLSSSVYTINTIYQGDNVSLENRGELLQSLDRIIGDRPIGGCFDVDMMQDKISLLEGFLDSHSADENGLLLSNYDFSERASLLTRFSLDNKGCLTNIGNGRIHKVVAVTIVDNVFHGEMESLDLSDGNALCHIDPRNLSIFYQEGSQLYREIPLRSAIGQMNKL